MGDRENGEDIRSNRLFSDSGRTKIKGKTSAVENKKGKLNERVETPMGKMLGKRGGKKLLPG